MWAARSCRGDTRQRDKMTAMAATNRPPSKSPRTAPQNPEDWNQLARQLTKIAERLEALAATPPPGQPDPRETKALMSAVGRISQHTGVLKKLLGIGTPKPR